MPTLRRLWFVAVICCCAVASTNGPSQSVPAAEFIQPAQRINAPNFSVTDVQGKPFTLSTLKGRVVLLDFWAIACGGCKLELPWYVDFDEQYRSKGLSLVGLDMYGESPAAVKTFAATQHMRYPVAIGTDAIGDLYKLKEMPLTILIDRQGRIAVSHAGVVDRKLFESNIQKLLAE